MDILQTAECFGIDLYIGFADKIIERDFQGVGDLAGDLDRRLYFIAFILANDIPRNASGHPNPVYDTVNGSAAPDLKSNGNGTMSYTPYATKRISSHDPHKPDTMRTNHYYP